MHGNNALNPLGAAYATRTVTKVPDWHGLVALDMLFNNLASGLFLVAGMGELAAPQLFRPVATFAYPIAFVFLLADLVCLVLDLGHPMRFHHMLRVFKPSSPMSLGTWCLTIFSVFLAVLTALSFLPDDGGIARWVRTATIMGGLLPALGTAVYKGVLFSTSSQPGWKQARWLGAYLTTSAFLLGGVGVLAIAVITGQGRAVAILRVAVIGLVGLNGASLFMVGLDIRDVLSDPRIGKTMGRYTASALGVGLLLPLGLFVVGTPWLLMVGAVLVAMAAMVIRLEIVRMPHALTHASENRDSPATNPIL